MKFSLFNCRELVGVEASDDRYEGEDCAIDSPNVGEPIEYVVYESTRKVLILAEPKLERGYHLIWLLKLQVDRVDCPYYSVIGQKFRHRLRLEEVIPYVFATELVLIKIEALADNSATFDR